jgi:hypothetical protein
MTTRTRFLTIASVAAASVLVSILAATQAEARGKRAAATPTMAAKSNAVVRDHRGTATTARKLQCIGQHCPKPFDTHNAQTTGNYKPVPPPRNVRDHRGPNGRAGGGVTVKPGRQRPQHICVGWGCP